MKLFKTGIVRKSEACKNTSNKSLHWIKKKKTTPPKNLLNVMDAPVQNIKYEPYISAKSNILIY